MASNSVLTNVGERAGTAVDVKTHSIDHKSPDSGDGEKAASIPIPASDSCSVVGNPRVASLWLSEECKGLQESRDYQRQNECISETSNSEKHVAFENHSIISPKSVGKFRVIGHTQKIAWSVLFFSVSLLENTSF